MKLGLDTNIEFVPITIAVLIVSDTRTLETDTSGATLQAVSYTHLTLPTIYSV